ncbi:hypothetical protein [Saccharopolyspora spinosa]|uniref:hypothetical protein n=1 Tax=Saccharopolyspora spinosa TaxID=60894 RepID=UPI000316E809|nr:hypothetical protein [Saccharopolyspora spinosa]
MSALGHHGTLGVLGFVGPFRRREQEFSTRQRELVAEPTEVWGEPANPTRTVWLPGGTSVTGFWRSE